MMAEYIEREALLKHYRALANIEWNKKAAPASWSDVFEDVVDHLVELPAADVVAVVRCKDCEYCRYVESADKYKCDRRGYFVETVESDDYCSKGIRSQYTERKDTNECANETDTESENT